MYWEAWGVMYCVQGIFRQRKELKGEEEVERLKRRKGGARKTGFYFMTKAKRINMCK